jgi:hypothetical protein
MKCLSIILSFFLALCAFSDARAYNFVAEISSSACTFNGAPCLNQVAQPAGAVVLSSTYCNSALNSAAYSTNATGLQNALNSVSAGGSLYIPAGCEINLTTGVQIPRNMTIACAGDDVSGFYMQNGLVCSGGPNTLSNSSSTASPILVNGCVFSNTFNIANRNAEQVTAAASGCNAQGQIDGANDPIAFFGGSGDRVTNSLITHTFAGEGVLFDGPNNSSFDHNVCTDNYGNCFQQSGNHGITVQYNYVRNSWMDLEDAGAATGSPSTWDTGTWSFNTFVSTVPIHSGYDIWCSSTMANWLQAGLGCSSGGCTNNQYAGVTINNNTFSGSTEGLRYSTALGAVIGSSNVFINGANNTPNC